MSKPSPESREIRLHPEWKDALAAEFEQPYMAELRDFLKARKRAGAAIFPPGGQIFNALDSTPPSKVKAVILGQDPYHGPGQAHGLCFSVQPGVPPPPSLVNIFAEIRDDLGLAVPGHGCLQSWADSGVLLLNTVLTVERGRPGSHQGKGWERFTDAVIDRVNSGPGPVVFLLWGAHAGRKGRAIDRSRHLVLSAPHPSPLSAHRGFFGCKHFSKANQWLEDNGREPVEWSLPATP